MDSKKLMAVAIVAILVIAAVAVFAFGGSDEDDKDTTKPVADCRLVVFGNANNDDYLNADDVSTLKSIIASGNWDEKVNPYADANIDGKVNNDDVSYLQDLLDKKDSKMYYINTWGEKEYISYPITGNLATTYWEQADLTILLGLWDRVKACGNGSLNEYKNPGYTEMFSYGKGAHVDPEVVLQSGKPVSEGGADIKAVIPYTQNDGTAHECNKLVRDTGADMDIICLPVDQMTKVLTAGVLLSAEDRAYAYVNTADEVQKYVAEKLSSYKDSPKILVCMAFGSSNPSDILCLTPNTKPGGMTNGLLTYMNKSPAEIIQPETPSSFFTHVDIDWVNAVNPDWIVYSNSSGWKASTQDEWQQKFEENAEMIFGSTNAFKSGHILTTSNGTMNSFPGAFMFPSLLAPIYEEIDDQYAADMMNKWVEDGFCKYNFDNQPGYRIYQLPAKA